MMRTPIRSETEAFRLTIAGAVAVAAAIVIGLLSEALFGAVFLVVVLVIALIAYLRSENPDRERPLLRAAHAEHAHGAAPDARHVLVIANETLAGSALRERILKADGERVELDILAPVLSSRLHQGVSDIDSEIRHARVRLERSLEWAREQGFAAHGEVGDPSTTTAIEDELRDFGADEVIVVTHPREQQNWQERGELQRLQRELDMPVTHVVIGDGNSLEPGS
ncbi:MAG TPA: hypothetical protein VED41_06865 [Solirubrobacteraceae bacterium]|nr:hypothetical protein [Solirubrobacteraceae bacterium]